MLTNDDNLFALPLARRRRRGSRAAPEGGAAGGRAEPAPARVSGLLGRVHLAARSGTARCLAPAAAQDRRELGVDEELLATGTARAHPLPVELVEATLRCASTTSTRRATSTDACSRQAPTHERGRRRSGASAGSRYARAIRGRRSTRSMRGTEPGALDRVHLPGSHPGAGQGVRRKGRARVVDRRLRARGDSRVGRRRFARAGALRDRARQRAHRQRQLRACRGAARRRSAADPGDRRSRTARAYLLVAVAAAHAEGQSGCGRPLCAKDPGAAGAGRGHLQHGVRPPAARVHRRRTRPRRGGARLCQPRPRLAGRRRRTRGDGPVPDRGGPRARAPRPLR